MKIGNFLTVCILIVFLSIATTGCDNAPSAECEQFEAANNQLETNLNMYETVWDEIVNDRKINSINETNFDKNVTLISSPENVVGIDDFKAYYQNYLTGFSNITFTIVEAFGQGDNLAKHWRFEGTHTGDFFGIPPTGKEVNVEGVTLTKLKDGKIAQEQDFMDNMVFMQQLGLMPSE